MTAQQAVNAVRQGVIANTRGIGSATILIDGETWYLVDDHSDDLMQISNSGEVMARLPASQIEGEAVVDWAVDELGGVYF